MSCIAAISGGAADKFTMFINELMPKLFYILKNCNQKY